MNGFGFSHRIGQIIFWESLTRVCRIASPTPSLVQRRRVAGKIMVNLVIVSHSNPLAEGVKELADQMAILPTGGGNAAGGNAAGGAGNQPVRVATVGGVLDENGAWRLGTDAMRIAETIQEVWTQDGVLLLVDLGSAVLSAEMALEMVPPEMRDRCCISNAPIAEGAVTAALEASLGHDLETVNRAAENAGQIQKVHPPG